MTNGVQDLGCEQEDNQSLLCITSNIIGGYSRFKTDPGPRRKKGCSAHNFFQPVKTDLGKSATIL